ncbi:hypothetical protein D917_03293 [Trichinella nativa]|uniref:Uncharacterized protein n=1 Tax=Trichinella nativa TaxID=6335 RepID=A0A1Y3ECE3_9BILA|nr:hypothetical protein D917_03293 [Trichinella nativa]
MMKSDANDEAFSVSENGALAMLEILEDTKIDEQTYSINDDDFIFERKNSCPCDTMFKQYLNTREMMELLESSASNEAFSFSEEYTVEQMENLEDPGIDERTYTIDDEHCICEHRNCFACDTVVSKCSKTVNEYPVGKGEMTKSENSSFFVTKEREGKY